MKRPEGIARVQRLAKVSADQEVVVLPRGPRPLARVVLMGSMAVEKADAVCVQPDRPLGAIRLWVAGDNSFSGVPTRASFSRDGSLGQLNMLPAHHQQFALAHACRDAQLDQ